MSKKEKRRAARQAFPKAKSSPSSGSRLGSRSRGARRSGAAASSQIRVPTLRRAAIQGAILAVLYFVFIQWVWKSGAPTAANLVFAAGGFILYTAVAYGIDVFKYRRALRKAKGSSK